jgi:hypothetical protein
MGSEQETVRQSLAKALRRTDEALKQSAEAGQETIRRLVDTGREVSGRELGQAFDNLQKVEEQFIATVGQVAESAAERVPESMRESAGRSARASTENTRQAAAALTKLSERLAGTSIEFGFTCLELSSELGVRCARIAGGWLAGMADAFDKTAADGKAAEEVRAAAAEAKKSL